MDGQNGGNEPMNPANPQGAAPGMGPNAPEGAGFGTDTANSAGAGSVPGIAPSSGAGMANPASTESGYDASSEATGRAIFSNPDLTIEKDAIPEELGGAEAAPSGNDENTGNANRVAAAFASTDASKKALIPIPNNNITQSTATGDIKLAPTPRRKRSKLPWIIGAGVVAVAAIIVIVVLMGGGGGTSTQTAFDSYYKLVVNGPDSSTENTENEDETENDNSDFYVYEEDDVSEENTSISEDAEDGFEGVKQENWFLLRGGPATLSDEEYESYANTLRSSYQDFFDSLDDEQKNENESYRELLYTVIEASNIERTEQEIVKIYRAEGKSRASEYIGQRMFGAQDMTAAMVMTPLSIYFNDYLKSLEIYDIFRCISPEGAILECEDSGIYDDQNFLTYQEEMSDSMWSVISNTEIVKDDFKVRTEALREQYGSEATANIVEESDEDEDSGEEEGNEDEEDEE